MSLLGGEYVRPGQHEASQLKLFDAESESRTYHDPTRPGYFALLVAADGASKRQDCYRLTLMPRVLSMVDPSRDTWLSQAEFARPNRRVVNLARVGLLFADLDTYREPWARGRTPEQQVASVLSHCASEGIPMPSLLIHSGRGLQAKWLLDSPVPRWALPRWNACQRYLVDRLAPLGADTRAKDASRVLRLVDTVNTKSGKVCRVVHVENTANGQPVRYCFEFLAETLLPLPRWTIEQQRSERRERRHFKSLAGGKVDNLRGFSGRQLAWDRLEDLRKLTALRGGAQPGERMQHLFWQLNFLLLSGATNSTLLYHEAAALARELDPRWSYRSPELMTLYAKAKAFEAGERVKFGGRSLPPLYTPRSDTLIDMFRITDEEQRVLRTLISRELALDRRRARDRKRDATRRQAAGAISREAYESNSLSRAQPWTALGISRATWYRAGRPDNRETSPSPITNGEASAAAGRPTEGQL